VEQSFRDLVFGTVNLPSTHVAYLVFRPKKVFVGEAAILVQVKECVKFMLQLLSLELGQSVRFAFMLNVPHDDDGPLVNLEQFFGCESLTVKVL